MKIGIFPFGYLRWVLIFSELIILHLSTLNSFPLKCTLLSLPLRSPDLSGFISTYPPAVL